MIKPSAREKQLTVIQRKVSCLIVLFRAHIVPAKRIIFL